VGSGVAEVNGYKAAKVRGGKLGPAQINKTLKVLAMILDVAIEYEPIDRANPARGRRRRVKAPGSEADVGRARTAPGPT
jgi:hypothetical protein